MNMKSLKRYIKNHPAYRWVRNAYIYLELRSDREEFPFNTIPLPFQKKNIVSSVDVRAMRLGVAYMLFDGEELLEYSIRSIKKNVDFICVVWQKISYHGEPCDPELEPLLNKLVQEGLIDQLYLYESEKDVIRSGGETSSIKRNIGLELCRENGCTHHISMDTDEFYTDSQFKFMKEEMLRGGYGTGYCRHLQYYKDSIYQLKYPEREYVTTIEKITPNTKYVYRIPCVVAVSPERKTNNVVENGLPYRIFSRKECEMHHLSFVRKDIGMKLRNGSLDKMFPNIDAVIEHYKNWKYPQKCMWVGAQTFEVVEVPRRFEIYKVD